MSTDNKQIEDLAKEKAEYERQIQVNKDQISTAETAIYWLKKRIKAVEGHISALQGPETDAEQIKDIKKDTEL
jgi:phage shock protein A